MLQCCSVRIVRNTVLQFYSVRSVGNTVLHCYSVESVGNTEMENSGDAPPLTLRNVGS